jgi:hypothetical protein
LSKFLVEVKKTDENDTEVLEFNKYAKKLEATKFEVELGRVKPDTISDEVSDEIRHIV